MIARCFRIIFASILNISHSSEEFSYGKQSRIFGELVIVGTILNVMGLIHILWVNNRWMKDSLSYEINCFVVMVEKMMSYLVAFFSEKVFTSCISCVIMIAVTCRLLVFRRDFRKKGCQI